MASGPVEIQGLKEFRKELRQFEKEWKRAVKEAHWAVAQIVVEEAPKAAKKRPPSRGPQKSRRGAMRLAESFDRGTTVAGQTLNSARIKSRLPDAFGQEFGSHRFRRFAAWVGKGQPGRVGYEARDQNVDKIREEYGDHLMDSFRKAYPNG